MNVDSNGQPFVWKASLKNLGYNLVEHVIKFSDKVVKMDTKWSSRLQAGSIMWENFKAAYKSDIKIKPAGGYEEIGFVYYNGTNTTYHYKSENTGNKTEACVTGSVMEKSKFGNCVEKYIGPYKQGYVVKILTDQGK